MISDHYINRDFSSLLTIPEEQSKYPIVDTILLSCQVLKIKESVYSKSTKALLELEVYRVVLANPFFPAKF